MSPSSRTYVQRAAGVLTRQYDVAAEFLANISRRPDADELLSEWTPEEEKKVKRKVSLFILQVAHVSSTTSCFHCSSCPL